MKDKLEKLLAAARNEQSPVPRADWAGDVLRAARALPPTSAAKTTLADLIVGMFPRVAVASVSLIALLVATDFLLRVGRPDLQTEVAAAADQFVFVAR